MGLVIMIREYDHIETWSLKPDKKEYRFLYPDNPYNDDMTPRYRVRIAAAVRDWIGDLSPYKATFTASEVADEIDPDIGDNEIRTEKIRSMMLFIADSWRAPEYYLIGEQNGKRWVNPNYKDVHLYTDGSAECECGQIVTKMNNTGGNAKFGDVRHHNDGCLPEWRADMVRQLTEKRRQIFYVQGLLGKSARSLHERLHTGYDDVIHMYRSAFDIEYGEIRNRGREKRNRTIARMISDGIDDEVIARIFDLSPSTLRNIVRRDTPYDIRSLRSGEVAL